MQFYIDQMCVFHALGSTPLPDGRYCIGKTELPKLDWIPAMQRRRLSAFNKMALYCANQVSHSASDLPVVFSSRHGDLNKTSGLLDSLVDKDSLSPTAFSMSVHNATPGLLSILTNNRASSNTISAGRNTFSMALIDSIVRLYESSQDNILLLHCDQALPEAYLPYSDEIEVDHCVAMVVSKRGDDKNALCINYVEQTNSHIASEIPQALCFSKFYASTDTEVILASDHSCWKVSRFQ